MWHLLQVERMQITLNAPYKINMAFDRCCSQVVELIWITVDPATCVPHPEMTGLAQLLVGRVMALRPRFSVALHKAIAGACVFVFCNMSHNRQGQQGECVQIRRGWSSKR
jgi:hypothetical protein